MPRNSRRDRRKPAHVQALSVCMIVRDEAQNLRPCTEHIRQVASEIVVVDTGSKDDTIRVATDLGARVLMHEWRDDFADARNVSLAHASGDWMLWLDADDRMAEAGCRRLAELIQAPQDRAFFLILDDVAASGASQCYQMRVVPNLPGIQFRGAVHEELLTSVDRLGLTLVHSDVRVRHTGYEDERVTQRKTERNRRLLERRLADAPDDPMVRYYYGLTFAEGNPPRAMAELERVVVRLIQDSHYNELYRHTVFALGGIYEANGRVDTAIRAYETLLSTCPGYAIGHFLMGRAFIRERRFREAAPHLEAAVHSGIRPYSFPLDLDGIRSKLHIALAMCLEAEGALDAAVVEAKKGLSFTPDSASAALGTAKLLLRAGQADASRRQVDDVLEREPDNAEALGLRARIAVDQGDLAGACEWAQEAAVRDPAQAGLLVHIGDALLEHDDLERAEECYARALDPGAQDVLDRLAETGQAARAVEGLGDVCFRRGLHEQAVELYETCLRLAPDHGSGFCKLGECYRAMGAVDAACDCYRAALQAEPHHPFAAERLAAYAH